MSGVKTQNVTVALHSISFFQVKICKLKQFCGSVIVDAQFQSVYISQYRAGDIKPSIYTDLSNLIAAFRSIS